VHASLLKIGECKVSAQNGIEAVKRDASAAEVEEQS
jgi:uncharacterized protein YegP (UPF0339 family)